MLLHNYCITKRIVPDLRKLHGLTEIQPHRWEETPLFDKAGRPVKHLKNAPRAQAAHSLEAPVLPPDVSVSTDCLESFVRSQDPLTGTGPWVIRPDFESCLLQVSFHRRGGQEYPSSSGNLDFFTSPPRCHQGVRCAHTHQQRAVSLGDDPDTRPVKAEDFDTSAWTKALARTVSSTVRDTAQPSQLGVGVSGGGRPSCWG